VKRILSLFPAILIFTYCTTTYAVDDKNSEVIAKQIISLCHGKEVLLLGETHQNPMSQELFLSLVRNLLDQGKYVFVGLEISSDQQNNLDALLAGSTEDELQLYPAIDHIAYRNMLKHLGYCPKSLLTVAAIDAADTENNRDEIMARAIVNAVSSQKYTAIAVLVGNLHAIKKIKWHPESGASTRYLAERLVDKSIDVCSVMQEFSTKNAPVILSDQTPEKAAMSREIIKSTYHADDMTGDSVTDAIVVW
jgi:hypothetical protein